ncbi:MAG: archease [Candidatus Diapherotrites archaeon]|nr:archease [Candidatus Diapherotrites archaeon]
MESKFKLLEHGADYGVQGTGKTTENAFEHCAEGMFSIIVDLKKVKSKEKINILVTAKNLEELLINWLNELLYKSHVKHMLFSKFKIEKIKETKSGFELNGIAKGEKINSKKHEMALEVKGATYTGVKVEQQGKKWIAQCVVDV